MRKNATVNQGHHRSDTNQTRFRMKTMKTKIHSLFSLLALCAFATTPHAQAATFFPIATNGVASQTGFFSAFGGTNYLVGIQGDGTANNTDISAQLISSNGTLAGSRILIGRTGGIPYVASGGTNFLLIWSDNALVAGGGNDQIYGQFISRSGALVGSPFTFGPTSDEQDMQGGCGSLLAFDGRNYLAVWDTAPSEHDAPIGNVQAALFSQTGSLVVPIISITSGTNPELTPVVTFGKTNYLVVWNDVSSGNIDGEFISTNGTQGSAFVISQTTTPSYNPLCAAFDGTNFFVVWNKDIGVESTIWNLYGRVVSSTGTFPGNEMAMVADSNFPVFPSIGFDGANYLLAWLARSSSQIQFQFFNAAASPVGPEFNLFSPQGTNTPVFGGVYFDGSRFEITAVVGGATGNGPSGIDFTSGSGTWGTFCSKSTTPPTLTAGNLLGTQFPVQLTGTPGINYSIQISTNLALSNWTAVITNSPTNGVFTFSDTHATNSNRFYRGVTQ
jgi:hypothetical protein